jgi:hypothetical protein
MPTCFVIQPFDKGKYDKRYEGVFRPAIEAAGLEAYRVDHDVSVEVPITSIEDGIKNATVCLAEISEDNANVWFELGYALALGRPVVMVCSSDRQKFPFDIQHRLVIVYKSEGPKDFEELKRQITERITARLTNRELLQQVAEAQLVSDVKGISNPEVMLIAAIVSESAKPGDSAAIWHVRRVLEQQGLTAMAFQLGLRRLLTRQFVEETHGEDQDGRYDAVVLTDSAWTWIDENESMFKLQKPKPGSRKQALSFADDFADDDIPF